MWSLVFRLTARKLRETKDELAPVLTTEKSHENQFKPNQGGGGEQDLGDLATMDYTPALSCLKMTPFCLEKRIQAKTRSGFIPFMLFTCGTLCLQTLRTPSFVNQQNLEPKIYGA